MRPQIPVDPDQPEMGAYDGHNGDMPIYIAFLVSLFLSVVAIGLMKGWWS